MLNAPEISYYSARLIGIELEIDAGSQRNFTMPSLPSGWVSQHDGSLTNGKELVLDPPRTIASAKPMVDALCNRLVNINVRKTGSLHVHVQVADYTHEDAFNLVRLYTRYQKAIDSLVGLSRQSQSGNHYCPAYENDITQAQLVNRFGLNRIATNRRSAKANRVFHTINLAMMRCATVSDRTVEFRQGSVSKRAPCVMGWATLMVMLVEMAKTELVLSSLSTPTRRTPSIQNFADLIRRHENYVGANGVADWVLWRHSYLNANPTDEQVTKLCSVLKGGYRGLYTVSRELDINLAMAKRLLNKAVEDGKVSKHATKELWTVCYAAIAAEDLARLEEAGARLEAAEVTAATTQLPAVEAMT